MVEKDEKYKKELQTLLEERIKEQSELKERLKEQNENYLKKFSKVRRNVGRRRHFNINDLPGPHNNGNQGFPNRLRLYPGYNNYGLGQNSGNPDNIEYEADEESNAENQFESGEEQQQERGEEQSHFPNGGSNFRNPGQGHFRTGGSRIPANLPGPQFKQFPREILNQNNRAVQFNPHFVINNQMRMRNFAKRPPNLTPADNITLDDLPLNGRGVENDGYHKVVNEVQIEVDDGGAVALSDHKEQGKYNQKISRSISMVSIFTRSTILHPKQAIYRNRKIR